MISDAYKPEHGDISVQAPRPGCGGGGGSGSSCQYYSLPETGVHYLEIRKKKMEKAERKINWKGDVQTV